MVDRLLALPAAVRMALFAVIAVGVLYLGYTTMSAPEPGPDVPTEAAPRPVDDGSTVVSQGPATEGAPAQEETVDDYTDGVDLRLGMPVGEEDLRVAASRAVRFAELFLSYRYNEDRNAKADDLDRLLAADNSIDLTAVFPSGPLAEQFQAERMTTSVEVTEVEVAMLSASMLSLNLVTAETTSTVDEGKETSRNTYAVTLTFDPNRSAWFVTEFLTDGGPFQDEQSD